MSVKEHLDEALEELKDVPEKVEEKAHEARDVLTSTFDAAQRRLEDDWLGRIAVIVAFILIGFANMGLSWLEGKGFITPTGLILVLGGIVLYIAFRIMVLAYNYASLRLQEKAVLVDIEEAKAHRAQLENQNYLMSEEQKIEQKKMLFLKNQNRLDQKLHQDLKLRIPFFETAQKELMKFFGREDIVSALTVPPTFVDAIERLDDALLKRGDIDITISEITRTMGELTTCYKDIHRQTLENAELINQFLQKEATLTIKWKETDTRIIGLQKDMESMSSAIGNLMEVLTAGFEAVNGKKPVTSTDTSAPAATEIRVTLPESPPETPTSIAAEVDALLDEEEKKKKEGELSPPP